MGTAFSGYASLVESGAVRVLCVGDHLGDCLRGSVVAEVSGPIQALVVAVLMFSLTVIFSMSIAGLLGGTSRLPPGFRGSAPPQRGLIGVSAVAISAVLAIVPQLTVIALGMASERVFESLGAWILLVEPIFALLFAWYLTRRYIPPCKALKLTLLSL